MDMLFPQCSAIVQNKKYQKMLPNRQVASILNFFDIFGYDSGLSRIRRLSVIFYVIHISLATFFTIHGYQTINKLLLADYDYSEVLNQILQYAAAIVTYWLIIFDSISNQKAHKCFWHVFQYIDEKFCCQSSFTFKQYKVKMCEFFSMTIPTTILMLFTFDYFAIALASAYNALVIICELRVFFYIFCLEIIYLQLKMIAKDVKMLQSHFGVSKTIACPISERSIIHSFQFKRFKWFRGYFHCIHKMVILLNDIFGWSHVAAILFCVHLILTDLNWFYLNYSECDVVQIVGK